ncbi:hypothetical protein BGX30_014354 [Mortierella sp. GBA39]|nr:hypothetical protein BGX30_014354 [Mortierella sp. GBA39]
MSATRLASLSRLSLPLHQQHQHFFKQLPTRLQSLSRPLFLNPTIIARHKQSMAPNDNFALPVPTKADAKVLAEASRSTKSTYQLLYFPMHGRGELTRTLLVFSGAKWEELPLDLSAQKQQLPFKLIPILYETAPDGTILELAESHAIERYLANKYGLYGSDPYSTHKIDQIYTSTDFANQLFWQRVRWAPFDKRIEEAHKFYDEILPPYIANHEAQLEKNGGNGYYFGESITLADLKSAHFIDRVLFMRPKGAKEPPFSMEKSPNLWKVLQTVNGHPAMAAWKKTQRYRDLDAGSLSFFQF